MDLYAYCVKVVILGDSGVGKTSLRAALSTTPGDEDISSTPYSSVSVILPSDTRVRVQLWDPTYTKSFTVSPRPYFEGTHFVLLVFSVGSKDSFESCKRWMDLASRFVHEATIFLLVGNKTDCKEREVSREEAEEFAFNEMITNYLEVSALHSLPSMLNVIVQLAISHPRKKSSSCSVS